MDIHRKSQFKCRGGLVKVRLHLSERDMWHVSESTQNKEPTSPSGTWVAFDFSQPSILKCRRKMESERLGGVQDPHKSQERLAVGRGWSGHIVRPWKRRTTKQRTPGQFGGDAIATLMTDSQDPWAQGGVNRVSLMGEGRR